jgi:uncharacterized protein YukE
VTGLTWPAGNPDLLEQLANALDQHASDVTAVGKSTSAVTAQVRSGAGWTGSAADAYTQFATGLSHGIGRAAPPLTQIASAVRGYAGTLRTAQQKVLAYNSAAEAAQASGNEPAVVQAARGAESDAAQACTSCRAAGDHAAAQVQAATGEVKGIFDPDGALRGTIERIHTILGAAGVDGILWYMGKGAEQAEKFMKGLPKLEDSWLHENLAAKVWDKGASDEEIAAVVHNWWVKSDAAEAFGGQFVNDTKLLGTIGRITRLAGGPVAIAGDVSTIFSPPQSGITGDADRVVAGVNGELVGADTLGAAGQLLGVEALADLSLGPVGAGIAVGTGLYLAGAYAYKHWAWFRNDFAKPIGHAVVHAADDVGHGIASVGHDIASLF